MIQSMTGFGKEIIPIKDKNISIEIKSLNSKQADIFTRISPTYRDFDMDIRNILKTKLKRGKIECNIEVDNSMGNKSEINIPLAKEYFTQLKELSKELSITSSDIDIFKTVSSMPQLMMTSKDSIEKEEVEMLIAGINTVIEKLQNFRIQEGKSLYADLLNNVELIENLLQEVIPYEEERITKIKERIQTNLENISTKFDNERFEQEMIFYIEKLDINEEKVRLKNHCNYFKENLESDEATIGKKLGFIAQEMGREINTLGSKANHTEIQNIVVRMKEALEKIKEQVLNVL